MKTILKAELENAIRKMLETLSDEHEANMEQNAVRKKYDEACNAHRQAKANVVCLSEGNRKIVYAGRLISVRDDYVQIKPVEVAG